MSEEKKYLCSLKSVEDMHLTGFNYEVVSYEDELSAEVKDLLARWWGYVPERTCHFIPEETITRWDELDNEIDEPDWYSEGYYCSNCGSAMLREWFDDETHRANFNYCPYCDAKVVKE